MLIPHKKDNPDTTSVLDDSFLILDLPTCRYFLTVLSHVSALKERDISSESANFEKSATLLHGVEYYRALECGTFLMNLEYVISLIIKGPNQSTIERKYRLRR